MHAGIQAAREERGWSQQELARRAGVSRQLVGALESGRHVPNVAAALALARTLETTVELLFEAPGAPVPAVGDTPLAGPVATARVGDRLVAAPLPNGLEAGEHWAVADAVVGEDGLVRWLPGSAVDGFVIAGCDPLLGLLSALVGRSSPHRVLTVHASTIDAVDALGTGRAHGAVVHGQRAALPVPPVPVRRWHLARWQVGLASARPTGPPTIEEIVDRRWRVVQRNPGASSQQTLERAVGRAGGGRLPGPIAADHLDVARRVATGGGRAGVTMEAAAIAFGLGFHALEEHTVELWVDERWASLPALAALLDVARGRSLRERAPTLQGYELGDAGTTVGTGVS